MPNLFVTVFALLFGLILGSFLNVVILRDDQRKSILTDRSRCVHCKHVLAWYDLVPVLSFILLGARCRYCRKPISWQYPLVECVSALLVWFAVWQGQGNWWAVGGLVVVSLILLVLSVMDILTMEIAVEYCILAGVLGGIAMVSAGQITWVQSLQGAVFGGGIILLVMLLWKLIFHQDAMGVGDIWLAAAIGAVLGFPLILPGLMAAVFIGAIAGLGLMLFKKGTVQMAIPFGPFLALGMLLAFAYGPVILQWYTLPN